jgi:hypothetical protein
MLETTGTGTGSVGHLQISVTISNIFSRVSSTYLLAVLSERGVQSTGSFMISNIIYSFLKMLVSKTALSGLMGPRWGPEFE